MKWWPTSVLYKMSIETSDVHNILLNISNHSPENYTVDYQHCQIQQYIVLDIDLYSFIKHVKFENHLSHKYGFLNPTRHFVNSNAQRFCVLKIIYCGKTQCRSPDPKLKNKVFEYNCQCWITWLDSSTDFSSREQDNFQQSSLKSVVSSVSWGSLIN